MKVHDDTNNNLPTAPLCREFKALQNEQGYTISTWFVMKYSLNFAMLKLVLHSDSSQLHLYLYLIQISCINICFWNKELQTVEIIYVSLFFRQKSWRYLSICQILYNLNIISLSILNDDESLGFSFFIFQI